MLFIHLSIPNLIILGIVLKFLSLIRELTLLIYLAYFQNSEPPIVCYKYNKPIRNNIFNFNKFVSDLDIHANTPKS